MAAYPTGFPDIDALPVSTSEVVGDATLQGKDTTEQVEVLRGLLLFLAVESCDNGTNVAPGFVVSVPTDGIVGTQVVAVSPEVLDTLNYADKAAYQAALDVAGFVHSDDLLSATAHVSHGIAAPYKLRLRRGDNAQYVRCLVRGISVAYKGVNYRITIIRREP